MSARSEQEKNRADKLDKRVQEQDLILNHAGAWARAMKQEHTPYVGGRIDLSMCSNENLTDKYVQAASENLFCRACSTRWPCKTLQNVRELSDILHGANFTGLPCTTENQQESWIYL